MPCLKYIIQNATTQELRLLRGKTIECISLIGLAVGTEKFSADASEVMEMLLKTQTGDTELSDDDPQVHSQYITYVMFSVIYVLASTNSAIYIGHPAVIVHPL